LGCKLGDRFSPYGFAVSEVGCPGALAAAAESGGAMVATYAPLGGPASVPHGWLDFCRRYAGECGGGPLAPLDISLTARAM